MDQREISRVADAVVVLDFDEGAAIVAEGDAADGMYFVKSGQCVVKQSARGGGEGKEAENEEDDLLRILKTGARVPPSFFY